jgi:putative intracellular protease/amidase
MTRKSVLFVIAYEGYQQVEYNDAKKVLESHGFTVITASTKPGAAVAKDGSTTPIDILLDKVKATDYAGIYFIGGPGALEYLDNNASYQLLTQAAQHNVPYGAICIAPRILAKAGVLVDKKATGWDEDKELAKIFQDHDVTYIKLPVVVDGTIITATGPSAAKEFGNAIVQLLG